MQYNFKKFNFGEKKMELNLEKKKIFSCLKKLIALKKIKEVQVF